MKRVFNIIIAALTTVILPGVALAQHEAASGGVNIPLGAGIAIGFAALGGALGQGKLVGAIAEAIGRNPSAAGKMNVPLFVGLALIESLVILAFVVAYGLAGKV